jgi:hypothetical protein
VAQQIDVPQTIQHHDHEYRFLGTDAEQGHNHYYRYTPEYAEILLLSHDQEEQLQEDDRIRGFHGDPENVVREYQYNHPWEVEVEEITGHDYRSIPDPNYREDLNEVLGGSLILDDYVLPFRASLGTTADILEQGTEDNQDIFVDDRPYCIELTPSNALEKYQFTSELRGNNEITGTKIIDEIKILDRGSEEVYNTFQVDELAEEYFTEELATVQGINSSLAESLIDEYTNLRTVSWASTSDVEHMENTWDIDCHKLFKQLGETGVYRNEHSLDAGVLQMPERVKEEHDLLENNEGEEDDDTEQIGLNDF